MSHPPSPPSRSASSYAVGILCTLMGILVVAIAFGFIGTDPSKIQAPRWLLTLFGATFVVAGVWSIVQRASRGEETAQAGWINFGFALLVMLAISVVCLWIGFGPGERLFVQEVGTGIDPATRPVDPTTGRIFFGGFGVLMSLLTVYLTVARVRKLLAAGRGGSGDQGNSQPGG